MSGGSLTIEGFLGFVVGDISFENLKKKYFKAFTLIILFGFISQIFIQSYIYFQKPNAKIINMSGRQRMLSQRITRYALAHKEGEISNQASNDTLEKLMVEFRSSHGFLKSIAQQHFWVASFYKEVHKDLLKLDDCLEEIRQEVQCVVDQSCQFGLNRKNALVAKTDAFLVEMDQVVKRFEVNASNQLFLLGIIEICLFLLTLAILFYEYLLVVVPLNKYVKKQVDSLEKKHADFLEQQAMVRHSSKLATVGELAAGVGHEINNPLTIMFAHIGKLKKQESYSSELVLKIENSANRIASIVRGLQKFSRSNDKSNQRLELTSIVKDTVDSLQMFVGNSNIQINCLNLEEEKYVVGNQGEIRQVVVNLVKNSVDALSETEQPTVTVSCYKKIDWVCIDVSDNGPGIPEELQEKIFQPFFTTKNPNEGTGLGLAIIRRLVKDGGGQISFHSSEEGTTFQVKFPSAENINSQIS